MSKWLSTQTDPWSELTDGGLGNMFLDFERFCLSAIIRKFSSIMITRSAFVPRLMRTVCAHACFEEDVLEVMVNFSSSFLVIEPSTPSQDCQTEASGVPLVVDFLLTVACLMTSVR